MCQYLAKRVRPDILCPVVFLSTRVQAPDVDDLAKLERMLKYINGTKSYGICIEPDKDGIMSTHVYVDASFAVHHEFRSRHFWRRRYLLPLYQAEAEHELEHRSGASC